MINVLAGNTMRWLKSVVILAVLCILAFIAADSIAHPLGQGNCWPMYHTWRDAQFHLEDVQQQLNDSVAELDAATAANDFWRILNATISVVTLTAALNEAEDAVDTAYQNFLDCDHF